MQKPSLGRVVLLVGRQANFNGADVASAIVTRVWGEHPDGGFMINATVLPDGMSSVIAATSVRLVDDEETARAMAPSTAAFWPPRV